MSDETQNALLNVAQLTKRYRKLVAVDHNWVLIYLVAIGFILLIGPLHWLTTLRRLDWRLSLVALLAVVAMTTLVYDIVGRRGVGERTVVHSIGYAKQISPGVFDVAQHVHIFVAAGGQYPVQHSSDRNLYSAGQVWERVPAMIVGGRPGVMQVDIPLYSSRGLLHRARIDATPLDAILEAPDDAAAAPTIPLPADLPGPALRAWAVGGDGSVHELRVDGDAMVPVGQRQPANSAFEVELDYHYGPWGSPRDDRPI